MDDREKEKISPMASDLLGLIAKIMDKVGDLARTMQEKDRLLQGTANLLKMNADQFRHYEQLHAAKGTEDGRAKAASNAHWAGMNEAMLERIKL